MTKKLSESYRQQAVDVLKKYKDLYGNFSEKQIWTKTLMCLLVSYIHTRDIDNAQTVWDELYKFYGKHTRVCVDYQKELNVLRRKVTPFYELEISARYLKKAVNFFAPSNTENAPILYPRQYFMALVNFSSNQICSGKFADAFANAKTAIVLYNEMQGMRFPRLEIALNNYLLSGYLSGEMPLPDVISGFCALLEKLENIADKTIIETNLAALYLMNYQKHKAKELLYNLEKKIGPTNCKECSYIYHVKQNLLIIANIESDWSVAERYLHELDEIVPILYQNTYFLKKHKIMTQYVLQRKVIPYKDDFPQTILEADISSSAWRFYGMIPAFNTLEYWSEP